MKLNTDLTHLFVIDYYFWVVIDALAGAAIGSGGAIAPAHCECPRVHCIPLQASSTGTQCRPHLLVADGVCVGCEFRGRLDPKCVIFGTQCRPHLLVTNGVRVGCEFRGRLERKCIICHIKAYPHGDVCCACSPHACPGFSYRCVAAICVRIACNCRGSTDGGGRTGPDTDGGPDQCGGSGGNKGNRYHGYSDLCGGWRH